VVNFQHVADAQRYLATVILAEEIDFLSHLGAQSTFVDEDQGDCYRGGQHNADRTQAHDFGLQFHGFIPPKNVKTHHLESRGQYQRSEKTARQNMSQSPLEK